MPDFNMKQQFPIADVINAAQRKAQLDNQTTLAQSEMLNNSLSKIGEVSKSLFDQKQKVAQALAFAHMYANSPEGQKMLGTNEVAQTAQGPLTQNQTASYDPATGTTTPLKSPVDVRTIATAMYGMSPKEMMDQTYLRSKQAQDARTAEGELALKQKIEPQKLALDEQIRTLLAGIQGKEAETGVKRQESQDINDLLARRADYSKDLATGFFSSINNEKSKTAKQEIARIDVQLASKGYGSQQGTGLPKIGETIIHPTGVKITRTK